ncbi:WcbI family polysaccharide biosynthesis putative acetyltransferase [Halomonas sp. BC1]|uniref:WcbI family polysaccharide biosynthesis putative acetyltransferase n=1 Tax=Halomonas sp. BC1 TaxID=1670448 RepID=UPI0009BFB14C|nr:WcbI family polysaccharide biosynthesis putative acetyltransferase [Halomonas sp. BC1]
MIRDAGQARPRFLVLSGCQSPMISGFLETLTLGQSSYHFLSVPKVNAFSQGGWESFKPDLDAADFIYTQKPKVAEALAALPQYADKVRYFPVLACAAFHPDISYMHREGERFVGPMGDYHSVLITAAYFAGKCPRQALECFHPEVYEKVGFMKKSATEKSQLLERFRASGIELAKSVEEWERQGPWMRTLNHPTRRAMHDLVVKVLGRDGLPVCNTSPALVEWVDDNLARSAEWPVYPGLLEVPDEGIDQALGRMLFKSPYKLGDRSLFMNLNQFIDYTYASLEGTLRDKATLNNFDLETAIDVVRGSR